MTESPMVDEAVNFASLPVVPLPPIGVPPPPPAGGLMMLGALMVNLKPVLP
jgi:hypothetical protein